MGTAAGQRRPHILQYPAPAKRSITKFLVYTHVQGVYRNQGQTHQVREGQTGIITIIRKSPYNANYTSDTRPAWTGSYSISPRKQNLFPLPAEQAQPGRLCLFGLDPDDRQSETTAKRAAGMAGSSFCVLRIIHQLRMVIMPLYESV